ncbi:HlyD family type I secretion periplasmic adaptor subunit [Pelagimonas varians]|uniref:Membrane fusion protein (MFP) family protein n=1 Tax=Pelagimonas varians TaxID=696760 RepID=A0A238L5B3_9RHOB|nr:HlyD family type I secretion periplasmic adaptor subunit [Pelagimonas varians]PYG26259.1 HlyD family secretion protein/adhesin transport system membrane fusion protein [Pelagimonas varians]SMX50040.1 Hemolysin secretion protein D, chromosomal [Pelagimonas varians]
MGEYRGDQSFDLDDTSTFVWMRWAAVVILLGLTALVIWMVYTPVDEISKARGEIEPIAQVKRVESRHGGQLAELRVTRGQMVEADEIVALLDQAEAQSALQAAEARIAGLSLEIERLLALAEGREPDFSAHAEEFNDLVERETAALAATRAFIRAERSVIVSQIEEKRAEIAAIDEERPQLIQQITVAEEERAVQQDLLDRGLSARAKLAELREQEAQYRFDLAQLAGRRTIAEAEVAELQASLTQVELDEFAKARSRIAEADSQRRALQAEAAGLQSRVSETEIRSPIAGVIQAIPDDTIGDVIDPGGMVVTIVPADGGYRFSGRLSPRDVGFVSVGQPVRLKIDSFDYSRFGALPGTVEEVSPTTAVDERGTAFYEVLVQLDSDHFRNAEDGLTLIAGMTGEADIKTGAKTVFQYVWKPIYTNLDLALTER